MALAFDFPASASVSAAALHLLLATHPELDALPFTWQIDRDKAVRPCLPVDDPQGEAATRLLATALELDVQEHRYTSPDKGPRLSLHAEGRWGGAAWEVLTYVCDQRGGDHR